MERIAMSQEERDKLEWLKRAKDKVVSQREAAGKIGMSDRWVRKLIQRMNKQGDGCGHAWAAREGLRSQDTPRPCTSPFSHDFACGTLHALLLCELLESKRSPKWTPAET
jgi:hypothetical protein